MLRNSPALINLAWVNKGFFWDGGSSNLENQAYAPMAHPDELFQDLYELVDELNQDEEYIRLFKEAFNDKIQDKYVVRAIAQFEKTLVSANSKYDKYVRHEGNTRLDKEEAKGLVLFEQHCRRCHATDLFTDNGFHNNGLDNSYPDTHEGIYQGRYRVTFIQEDMGKFKTPTLRNIALTAPYMHDGRFATLEDVIAHYSKGIKPNSTVDKTLSQNGGLHISPEEQKQLIKFLHTITDYEFITAPANNQP